MSKENQVFETQIFRTPPSWFLVEIGTTELDFAELYGRIEMPDGGEMQFMKSTGLGECPLTSGDNVSVTVGQHPVFDLDGEKSVLGVWNPKKCPDCIFNPENPKYKELTCKAALKPEQKL